MYDFTFQATIVNYHIGSFIAMFATIGVVIQVGYKVDSFSDTIIIIVGTVFSFLVLRRLMSVFSNVLNELINQSK
jgi:hypothetical protein